MSDAGSLFDSDSPVFLEDLEVGMTRAFGRYEVSREEVVEFGRRFDPQPFHVDEEQAKRSPYGGLIASGWHTTAMTMRMLVEDFQSWGLQSLGSPGVDDLRWRRPVRPGDVLSLTTELVEARPSRSSPTRGSVKLRVAVKNQDGDEVMSMLSLGMVRRRPRATEPP